MVFSVQLSKLECVFLDVVVIRCVFRISRILSVLIMKYSSAMGLN